MQAYIDQLIQDGAFAGMPKEVAYAIAMVLVALVVLAAALSLGEVIGSAGKDLLKAYVLGIEVLTKMAANAPNVQERGFHATPVWGSIGAAVACASLLRFDPVKIKAALGVAASGIGGIHRPAQVDELRAWADRPVLRSSPDCLTGRTTTLARHEIP